MGTTIKDAIAFLSELDPNMELVLYVAEDGNLTASTAEVSGFTVELATNKSTPMALAPGACDCTLPIAMSPQRLGVAQR